MLWDIFCRVIDNFGDIGVCWRLSADLAARGHAVRLWVDDPAALAWMAPPPRAVDVQCWDTAVTQPPEPGDVVVEAFGCDPPDAFVHRMQRAHPPCWVNLEYLSAESYVERSHGLPSPVGSGPGAGLRKWFYYPGFTERTGGLLREPGLLAQRDAFQAEPHQRTAWLTALQVGSVTNQLPDDMAASRWVSVFCYDSAPLPKWLDALADSALTSEQTPTTVLLTPGPATRLARQWQAAHPHKVTQAASHLRLYELPHLSQTEFDRLLWSCDLNFVRGEDSAVRALWAGKPHIWQIYEQDDGVHAEKLQAFMDRWMAGWDCHMVTHIARIWRAWNLLGPDAEADIWASLLPLASSNAWSRSSKQASDNLANQADLSTQLIQFVTQAR